MSIPSSITEQIESVKDLELSYRILHNNILVFCEKTQNIIEIPFQSLVDKYRDVLEKIVISVNLDDRLSRHYLFKPKLLSYDLYGTVELWSEILRLNHLTSMTQFKLSNIKIYDPYQLKTYLNEILILENKV